MTALLSCSSPSGLSVHYSLKNVGMEYDRSLFGMKLADCRSLAKCLEKTEVSQVMGKSPALLLLQS